MGDEHGKKDQKEKSQKAGNPGMRSGIGPDLQRNFLL
jgi:hypothetical protein